MEHVQEARRRLIYIVISVLITSTLAYFIQQRIVHFILAPARHQQFIYTSPGGGISFLFQLCTYAGLVVSLPVIIFNLMKYIEPVLKIDRTRMVIKATVVSFMLATGGLFFGYYVGLPTALHFLTNQFQTSQIHALFTVSEYMSFLSIYLGGSALLFQLPLLVWFIDKMNHKGPRQFLKYERHVLAGSVIIAGIMAPVPSLIYQAMIALPIFVMYQIAIVVVWYEHRPGSRSTIERLKMLDREVAQKRLAISSTSIQYKLPKFEQFEHNSSKNGLIDGLTT
jgi:sec-independent protein translocase protein TatC